LLENAVDAPGQSVPRERGNSLIQKKEGEGGKKRKATQVEVTHPVRMTMNCKLAYPAKSPIPKGEKGRGGRKKK